MKTYKILDLFNVFGKKSNWTLPYSNPNTNAKSIHEALDELFEGGSSGSSGTVIVDELPEEGQEGKIYYNKEDNKLYISDGENYSVISVLGKIITDVNDVTVVPEFESILAEVGEQPTIIPVKGFALQPGYFYKLDGETPLEDPYEGVNDSSWFNHEYAYNTEDYSTNTLCLVLEGSITDAANVYSGRFRAPEDNTRIIIKKYGGSPMVNAILIDDARNLEITAGHLYEFNIVADVCIIKEIVE